MLADCQLATVGRSACELHCEPSQLDRVSSFKLRFAKPVLLDMVLAAQADGPAVRRFEPNSAIRPAADVSAFNRLSQAARHRTLMATHPRPMPRTVPIWAAGLFTDEPLREVQACHGAITPFLTFVGCFAREVRWSCRSAVGALGGCWSAFDVPLTVVTQAGLC